MTVEKQRIQFDLTPAMAKLLDRLVDETGAATRAEVMRRAISIFAVLVDKRKAGKEVEIVGPGSSSRETLIVL